jgi:hypothetical protein
VWRTENPPGYTVLDMGSKGTLLLPFSLGIAPRVVLEGSKAGDVVLSTEAFFAQEGRAFLRTDTLDKVEEVRGVVRVFSPLLRVFGLEDLEGALEELKGLEEDEVRVKEGLYVLARRKDLWVLLFGTFFGTPTLDTAFILGEELTFSYSQGLEISLRGSLCGHEVETLEMEIRWEGETARHRETHLWVKLTDRRFPQTLVRKTAKGWSSRLTAPKSPGIRALLRELSEREDPLEAPKEPGFFQKVRLRTLSQL